MPTNASRVLLTGATGFVGSALLPLLLADGWRVRATSRRPQEGEAPEGLEWVRCDVDDRGSVRAALTGCTCAYYLIHSMSDGDDYDVRERKAARAFAEIAEEVGVSRIVYLGGVQPTHDASKHLRSRAETGRALASTSVPVVELRAAMIVGPGSASWHITRDLALRLPAMVLPKWLESRSEPVADVDVFAALLDALRRENVAGVYGIPGPDALSARAMLMKVAALRGSQPLTLDIPLLSPRLSSGWIQLITRADPHLARELVEGLRADLLNHEPDYFATMGHSPLPFAEAAALALEREPGSSSSVARFVERFVRMISVEADA
jgi:uncharacterized protein YbjT (DUF2867 family)